MQLLGTKLRLVRITQFRMADHSSNNPGSFTDLAVSIHATKAVPPAASTPQEPLYLTNIDQILVVPVETLFVYAPTGARASECVFSVLEAALAQTLVPFHFMTGRFEVDADEGRLQVRCNRAGAAFVVATAEQTVRDLGDLKLMNPAFRKLVPAPPRENISLFEDFLLMVQVTRFKCGGFTVGFRMSHSMCDETSSALFFRTLEFAPEEVTTLLIAVDFRAKMKISPTFCGNTIISAHVSAAATGVATRPLGFCVRLIQDAMARVDERYARSAIDWLEVHRGGVPAIGSAKDVLVSAWWKFPFYEHDFGWGRPVHSGLASRRARINGRDDGGLLLLVSFQPHEMAKFERYIQDIQ